MGADRGRDLGAGPDRAALTPPAGRVTATRYAADAVAARVGVVIPPELVIALIQAVVQLVYACHPTPAGAAAWLRGGGWLRRWRKEEAIRRAWRHAGGAPEREDAVVRAVLAECRHASPGLVAGLYADRAKGGAG